MSNYRIFVEKYPQFRVEARSLLSELNENLQLELGSLRLLNVYDLFGFTPELLEKTRYTVFGEVVTDNVTEDNPVADPGSKYIAVEYLPGQFDQRAQSAVDCVHLIDPKADISIKSSKLLILDWSPGRRTSGSWPTRSKPPSNRSRCWKASGRWTEKRLKDSAGIWAWR